MQDAGSSIIENNGLITADVAVISLASSAGELKIVNTGVIKAFAPNGLAIQTAGNITTDLTISNTGSIIGAVDLGAGDDIYRGANGRVSGVVSGGAGDDILIGGKAAEKFRGDGGSDVLTGGRGADQFIFAAVSESQVSSQRDRVTDFSHAQHDIFNVHSMDANKDLGGNQNFTFIGTKDFHGDAGELHYRFKSGATFVEADIDGDRHADFSIRLDGHVDLVKSDFIL